ICHNLGNLYCLAGELPAAEAAFAQALEHSPGLARTQLQLDLLQLQTRSQEEILARYQSFVQRHPGHPALTRMLCRMARLQAGLLQPALALEYLNRALALDPEYVPAHLQRGKLLLEAQQSAQARSCFETVFALKDLPSGPALQTTDSEQLEALAGLAEVLIQEQRPAAATQLLEAFLETGDSSIASCYAEACGLLGSPEAALAPLEAVLAQPPLPLAERRILLYRLGGLHDLCRRPEQAFACFSAAKQAAPNDFDTGSAFDAGQCIRLTDALIHSFDAGLLAAALRGSSSRRPVFIVGMPRSGTSLTEAILCAHPDVFGAGELNLIQQLFRRLLGPDLPEEDGQTWRGRLQTLTAAEWATAASDYLQHLEALSDGPGYLRISDKMPANFRYLGLIQLLFPDAAVIHCQRHPLDVCLSCYSQPFSFLAYTRSLDDLGLYYQQYQRLMAHWRTVLRLPLLELRYEDLVQQPEATVRRLLDHCGLDWNPRCLDFHTNTRPVRTASSRQVRKPLYTSSVGRYKLYEPSLEPLKKYLDLTGW
ncbi:MAG: sulfotransferase, partial [Candidatus Sericytochromatia bacterium]